MPHTQKPTPPTWLLDNDPPTHPHTTTPPKKTTTHPPTPEPSPPATQKLSTPTPTVPPRIKKQITAITVTLIILALATITWFIITTTQKNSIDANTEKDVITVNKAITDMQKMWDAATHYRIDTPPGGTTTLTVGLSEQEYEQTTTPIMIHDGTRIAIKPETAPGTYSIYAYNPKGNKYNSPTSTLAYRKTQQGLQPHPVNPSINENQYVHKP